MMQVPARQCCAACKIETSLLLCNEPEHIIL